MTLSRRNFISAAGGAAVNAMADAAWAQKGGENLKISHQFGEEKLGCAEGFGLSGLIADEERRPVFVDAQRRA